MFLSNTSLRAARRAAKQSRHLDVDCFGRALAMTETAGASVHLSNLEGKTNFSRLRVGHELVTKNRNLVTIDQR